MNAPTKRASPAAYFDYAATTPADARVVQRMLPYFGIEGDYGNPSSVHHSYGTKASDAVEEARRKVAHLIAARPGEIVWTSGATEANNLAIRGVLNANGKKSRGLITAATEHSSVLETAKVMRRDGHEVEILPVSSKGVVDLGKVRRAVEGRKVLVSMMWVNNETGVIQPIREVASLCEQHGALLHVDAAQAAGKVDVNLKDARIDLMSLSAHKAYGPKGVGALFIRKGASIGPIASGGGQERGLRPGTLPVPLIVGMGEAFDLLRKEWKLLAKRTAGWNEMLVERIQKLGEARINGGGADKVPHILNVSFRNLRENPVFSMKRTAVSNGSACATGKTAASHVLRGMGLSRELAQHSLRVSFGRTTTDAEVGILVSELADVIKKLRA